jgi:hypothetical protein
MVSTVAWPGSRLGRNNWQFDGSVRIEAADRAGRERLLRYCARPPFALDRLRELSPGRLLYDVTGQSVFRTGLSKVGIPAAQIGILRCLLDLGVL